MIVLLLLPALLCGCGKGEEKMQEALDFRAALLQAGGCRFSAEVTASYDDAVYTFSARCSSDEQGKAELEITAPESLAGLQATVDADRKQAAFDDIAVDFGLLAEERVAPVSIPSILTQTWASSYIESSGNADGAILVVYQNGYEADALKVETKFDREKSVPLCADVWYNESCIASVAITEFEFLAG